MARKSQYYTKVEPHLKLIKQLRRDGAEHKHLYEMLGVKESTWYEYIKKFPELAESLKEAKRDLILDIKDSIYITAMGGFVKTKNKYKYHQGKKILISSEDEVMAPNTTAQAMALKILDPELREILNNTIQVNNTVTNNAMDNFNSFSEEINRFDYIEDDDDG